MRDAPDDAPFDLGVVGPGPDGSDEPPESPHRTSGAWQRWAIPAAALLVGGLLGAVVVDARHDAAELARVDVVSGPSNWTPASGEDGSATVDLQLMNIGSRPVEIVGVEADGFEIAAGTEPIEAVEAAVGDWVVVQQPGLVADCETETTSTIRVRVRDGDGDERTVEAEQNLQFGGLDMFWIDQCEFAGGYVQFIGPPAEVVVGEDNLTATTSLQNYSGRSTRVTRMVPVAPGMTASQPELPIELPGHGNALVETVWTVDDCAAAMSMAGDAGRVEFTVASGSAEYPESYPLDASTMVELVRLAGRVCG
jgi:hypothetical protein